MKGSIVQLNNIPSSCPVAEQLSYMIRVHKTWKCEGLAKWRGCVRRKGLVELLTSGAVDEITPTLALKRIHVNFRFRRINHHLSAEVCLEASKYMEELCQMSLSRQRQVRGQH